jgi:hypothetical protein
MGHIGWSYAAPLIRRCEGTPLGGRGPGRALRQEDHHSSSRQACCSYRPRLLPFTTGALRSASMSQAEAECRLDEFAAERCGDPAFPAVRICSRGASEHVRARCRRRRGTAQRTFPSSGPCPFNRPAHRHGRDRGAGDDVEVTSALVRVQASGASAEEYLERDLGAASSLRLDRERLARSRALPPRTAFVLPTQHTCASQVPVACSS